MGVSPLLEIIQLTESQSQKATAINEALLAMERALSDVYRVNTDDCTSLGFNKVLEYDDTNDLTERTALRCIYMVLEAGATHYFDLIHPPNKHLFIIRNDTGVTATLQADAPGHNTLSVPAGSTWLVYCDGEDFYRMDFTVANLKQAYDVSISFFGMPEPDQLVGQVYVAREITFPAGFDGSWAYSDVNPSVSRVIEVWDDGLKIGEALLTTGGGVNFSTVGGTAKVVTAGSVIRFYSSSASKDATLDGFQIVLAGSIIMNQA